MKVEDEKYDEREGEREGNHQLKNVYVWRKKRNLNVYCVVKFYYVD